MNTVIKQKGNALDYDGCTAENVFIVVSYFTLAINDVTCSVLTDTLGVVSRSKLRKTRKNLQNTIRKCRHYMLVYEKHINKTIGDRSYFFSDYCQMMQDKADEPIRRFREAARKEFERVGVTDSDVKSWVTTATMLVEMACYGLDNSIKEAFKVSPDVKMLARYRLTDLMRTVNELHEKVCYDKVGCDLNKDMDCKRAMEDIEHALTDLDNIVESIANGEKLNPCEDDR